MAKKIHLEIVTPEKKVLSVEVDEVVAPGEAGLFGVRPGHTPFIAAMQPGPLSYLAGGRKEVYAVGGGFVEVANDRVIVLAETAEHATEIDLERALNDQKAASERLGTMKDTDSDYAALSARVRRAAARIAVARGGR